ncbi:hypothetical protein [Flavobacterium sp.]|uniref:hypothetical protein n=1 Tax=Flavobacterium sp. TaxID=239 RepID=UPI00286DCF82|nr:hypothetical protein [Flavobacterium sp.]
MKNLKFILAAFIVFLSLESSAQVSINLNIGGRPDWCNNYEEDVQYVYMPEIECYYDVRSSVYIYLGGNGWIRSRSLPEYCHNYDMNRGYRVVLDYRGRSPYAHFDNHRTRYYRDNHRNYREEYYGHNHNRRSNHVAVVYNDKHHYKHNNKHRDDDDDDDRRGKNHGNGHDRGYGKR